MTVGKCTNSINFKQLVGDLCHFKLKMCAKCKRLKKIPKICTSRILYLQINLRLKNKKLYKSIR